MYESDEKLPGELERSFRKAVSVGELTIFLTPLSGTTALVLTNKAVYLLFKKWWKARCSRIHLKELDTIYLEDRKQLKLVTGNGEKHSLAVDKKFFAMAVKAVNRTLELLSKLEKAPSK